MHFVGRTTDLKFCFLPRVCAVSEKILWMKFVYYVTETWTDYGEHTIRYVHWIDKHQYLIYLLKKEHDDLL